MRPVVLVLLPPILTNWLALTPKVGDPGPLALEVHVVIPEGEPAPVVILLP